MLSLALVVELVLLYFLSRQVTIKLFELFLLIFRTRSVALSLLLVLEFPGTVIHELSHLFTAEVLGVHTGKLRLEPESIRGKQITSGSVMIAQTDPFRRYFIGLAPIFSGIFVLTAIAYFLPGLINNAFVPGIPFFQNIQFYYLILVGYLLFAVSNTMFSSPQDLAGFLPFGITVAICLILLYVIGVRINITGVVLTTAMTILTTLVKSIAVVLGINVLILIIIWILTGIVKKIFHVRIARF